MVNIAVRMTGRPSNGGSYQYWLNVLESLSMLDKTKYNVTCYAQDLHWEKIVKDLEVGFSQEKNKKNIFQIILERAFDSRMPKSFLHRFGSLWNPFVRQLKRANTSLYIAQSAEVADKYLKIPSIIPIFDLMHRYRSDIVELTEQYEMREKMYSYECQAASMILVDSEVGKEQVVECYQNLVEHLEQKIRILPFAAPDYIYIKESMPIADQKLFEKYIFYPAQFWTHKNHVRLLQAIKRLKDEGTVVNLVLVGSEQNNQITIQKWIQELGLKEQVQILGYVENSQMVYLYQHARALVMPTLFGPTNIPQLEAFELGCPVATSGIYGIPEQVGDAALLFDPENVEEIQKCVEELWNNDDLCNTLIEKGKEKAKKWTRIDFSKLLVQYIGEFENVCNV